MLEQASAIPFRWNDDSLEFCLITSLRAHKWGFPKGLIDLGETYVDTARKEACEEAGLVGDIDPEPVGKYRYAKWGTRLDVTVVLMRVTSSQSEWDESELRERRWVTATKARKLLHRHQLRDLLDKAIRRLTQASDLQ